MATTLLSPGPQYNILQNVIYALPGSPCNVVLGSACERSALIGGPFVGWTGGYNHVGGFIRCVTGGTTYKATKLKMKEMTRYSTKVLGSGPSNYWRLNETSGLSAVDMVGGKNGNIGGIGAGITLGQPGPVGDKAILFDGTGGAITTAADVPIPLIATIEGWLKPNVSAAMMMFSTWLSGRTGNMLSFGINLSAPYLTDDVAVTAIGVATIVTGQWNHLVCVLNGSTASFYVNGILNGTYPYARSTVNASPGYIGIWNGHSYTNAYVDEVAIYPRALTPAEILDHYNSR